MSKPSLVGLAVALVAGLIAGYVLGPLARGMAPAQGPMPARSFAPRPELEVRLVKGQVVSQTPRTLAGPVALGDRIRRPASIHVALPGSKLVVVEPALKLVLEHGAHAVLSAPPTPNAVLLEDGYVLLSANSPVSVHVPRHAVRVTGTTFSVWVDDEQVRTAVIEDSIEMQLGDEPPQKYARRREVIISGGTAAPSLLAPRIELSIDDVSRRSNGFLVRGQTSPQAVVLYRGEDKMERVGVRSTGSFSALLPEPDPRSLAAYDSSGRWAVLDVPSPTIDDFMQVAFGESDQAASP